MRRLDFQSRLVGSQVIAHRFECADLRADLPRLQVPRNPVMDEALAETYNFDICRASSPNLPLGQNFQPSRALLRLDLHLMRTDTGRAKLFQKGVLHFCNC
jgi:hypothetical protein